MIGMLVLLLVNSKAQAQDKTDFNSEKWRIFCQTWGLLKYNAPNSEKKAKNKADWDAILMETVPEMEECKNTSDLQKIIGNWIKKAGEYKEGKKIEIGEFDIDAVDLTWIDNSQYLDNQQKTYLKNIRWREGKRKNQYFYKNFSGLMDTAEQSYDIETKLSKNLKILTFFRIWNFVEYFFPYKNYMDKKWESAITEFIPIFLSEQSNNQFYFNVKKLTNYLQDGHASIQIEKNCPIFTDTFSLPFHFVHFKNNYVVSKIALNNSFKNELQLGDKLLKINGKTIESYVDSIKAATSFTNPVSGNAFAERYINSKNPNKVNKYEVLRNDSTLNVEAQSISGLVKYNNTITESNKILDGNIGYINISNFKQKEMETALIALQNCKSIIIDGRGYPNNLDLNKFLSYFTDKKSLKFLNFKGNNSSYIGVYHGSASSYSYLMPKSKFDFQGKIIYLTSPTTQSYAETVAMMFKAHTNATFIGEQPSSTNGNVIFCSLPYGLKMRITGLWTGNVDGSQHQRKGVKIDQYIEYDPNSFKNGLDNQLQSAINWINKLDKP